ncbi:36_t:CDS:2, partial [Ambispora gerdemannii]
LHNEILVEGSFSSLRKRDTCGTSGVRCDGANPCCSKWGYCGSSDQYCGDGCVAAASAEAACKTSPPPPPPPPVSGLNSCLSSVSGKVIYPNDADYSKLIVDENKWIQYYPVALVYAANVADVQTAVKCAKASKINVAPRSGGHSFESYSIGGKNGSLVIDLKELNQIKIDKSSNTAIIGAGNKLGTIYYVLSQAGYFIPAGTCPGVGISGLALGGGYGFSSRKYGLTVDSVLSMDMVDATGSLITANSGQNSELFFALRGAGGGSYGVVTYFTFKINQTPSQITSFQYKWPTSSVYTLIPALESYARSGTNDVTFNCVWSNTGLSVQGNFIGLQSDLPAALDSFLSSAPGYTIEKIIQHSFWESVVYFGYQSESFTKDPTLLPYNFKSKSFYVAEPGLSSAGIKAMGDFLAAPACKTYAILAIYGGVIKSVSSDAMAFIHRDPLFSIELLTYWDDGDSNAKACVSNINTFSDDWQDRYASPFNYQNYIDRDLKNWQNKYYGSSYPKLVKVKDEYDPDKLFNFPQAIGN